MILARLAVVGAVLCTLWFNASYAYGKGGDVLHQAGMVAVAVTIDLCKCGFLPAAAQLWQRSWRLPAMVLVILWPLAFSYSLFAGYAAIATTRTGTTDRATAQLAERQRFQADYERASAALALAQDAPLYETTAGCTTPKTTAQREFCSAIKSHEANQARAHEALSARAIATVDPELALLQQTIGTTPAHLTLLLAFAPALILELVASLGLYAVSSRLTREAPQQRPERVWRPVLRWPILRPQKTLQTPPAAATQPDPLAAWVIPYPPPGQHPL